MRVRWSVLGLAMSCLLLAGPASAESADAASVPRLVKVHADWCGTCTALEPTWNQLLGDLGDRVEAHVFDVTDRDSLRATRLLAESLGLGDFLDAHKGKTGTIALIGPDGRVVRAFKGELAVAPYRVALEDWERANAG